jgi:hypothetical protein
VSPLGFFTIAMKAARAASSPHATAAMLPLGKKSYHTGSIPDLNIRMAALSEAGGAAEEMDDAELAAAFAATDIAGDAEESAERAVAKKASRRYSVSAKSSSNVQDILAADAEDESLRKYVLFLARSPMKALICYLFLVCSEIAVVTDAQHTTTTV